MKRVTVNQSRGILIGIFLAALIAQFLAWSSVRSFLYPADLQKQLTQLLGVYGVHLGVMIGSVFAKNADGPKRVALLPFWLAFALVVIWNVLLCWSTISFIRYPGTEKADQFLDRFAALSQATSFLVAGALAYFFAKPGEDSPAKPARKGKATGA